MSFNIPNHLQHFGVNSFTNHPPPPFIIEVSWHFFAVIVMETN